MKNEANAKEPFDVYLIELTQSKIKDVVNDYARRERPMWELKACCEPIIRNLKTRIKNNETRDAIDETMDRYIRELYEHFTTFYELLRASAHLLGTPLKKNGLPLGGIPISENPLSYNMEPGAMEYFERYQRSVRRELDRILHIEPRRYDGNVNLRTIAELNIRYEKQTGMVRSLTEQGEDLVWIEPHANCSKRCEPWQGKLYSLSGRSGKTEDGIPFRPLSDATEVYVKTKNGKTYRNGCITGFGCRHKLLPHRPGRCPQMIPATVVERQRAAEEKQRALELRIRYEKEKAAILSEIDPEEAKKARRKATGLTRYYETFSAENSMAAVPTRLRTVQGEDIYKRNAPARERKRHGI